MQWVKYLQMFLNACYTMKEGANGKNYVIFKARGIQKSLFHISTHQYFQGDWPCVRQAVYKHFFLKLLPSPPGHNNNMEEKNVPSNRFAC